MYRQSALVAAFLFAGALFTQDVGSKDSAEPAPKTPIKAGAGTIKGKIVYGGQRPTYAKIPEILAKPDCLNCKIPPGKEYWHADQKWIVGKDMGLANVVVRLKTLPDSYYETSEADKKRAAKEEIVLDQPCCAFDPHVVVLFPYYTNGKKIEPTGQVLLVKNSGTMLHNTNFQGDARLGNNENLALAPGGSRKVVFRPENDKAVPVGCTVHPWMSAHLFAYDHPYATATKEDGLFELKNVNVGTQLTIEFWHAGAVVESKTVTLTQNENTKDLGTITIGK